VQKHTDTKTHSQRPITRKSLSGIGASKGNLGQDLRRGRRSSPLVLADDHVTANYNLSKYQKSERERERERERESSIRNNREQIGAHRSTRSERGDVRDVRVVEQEGPEGRVRLRVLRVTPLPRISITEY